MSSSATSSPAWRARSQTPLVSRSRPRFSISSKSTVGRSFASSRARSSSAPRPAYASTQPSRPQLQRRPPGLAQTWPISPAEPRPYELAPVDDDATPDTGAPEDTEERVEAPAGPEPALGLDGDVHVVPDRHRAPELLGERRPERVGSIPPLDVRDLEDGARSRRRSSRVHRHRRTRGPSARRRRRRARCEASRRARRRPPRGRRACGVSRRALPSTFASPSVTTAWILVPPRSSPARILVTTATARPRRAACGSRARSIPLRCARSGRAASPDTRTRGRSPASRRRWRRARGGPRPRPRSRSGTRRALPPTQRGGCSAPRDLHRRERALCPCTRIATTSPAPRTFSGTDTARASSSIRRTTARDDERPGLPVLRRAGESPRIEQPEHDVGGQRVGECPALVPTAGDREQRVHRLSLPAELEIPCRLDARARHASRWT